jgi:restriction system protein
VEEFSISPDEAEELIPSGRVTLLSNRAHWARTYLSKAGCLESPKRGVHRITDRGRQLLKQFPDRIDNASLRQFESFEDWRSVSTKGRVGSSDQSESTNFSSTWDTQETPEAAFDRIHNEIDTALATDLLDAVRGMLPSKFEDLIVDLLIAMGYGGGDPAMGQSIGKSGDGGIDGVINEDALGLDAVYIQAKRYAPENKVGRPALQAFVGSLTGEGASKGVFVTTSDFSSEARAYVERVQQRIVLINGARLARLMIQNEVGVRARKTYTVRSVDEDYFSEY